MRINKIQALVLTLGVALASGAMFAGKADAQTATATSPAFFFGFVAPACTVTADFGETEYMQPILGPSGGAQTITGVSDVATFNCNSNTVNISTAITTFKPPAPSNATALVGTHTAVVTLGGVTVIQPTATNVPTNTSGNISGTVQSTWVGGEDLLTGDYGAIIEVAVTAN